MSHTLTVDGEVQGRGGAWRSVEAGGGSGGSILMNVYTIDGSGLIDASGGAGYDGRYASHGGGGGGGFVALYYKYNFFVGELIASSVDIFARGLDPDQVLQNFGLICI